MAIAGLSSSAAAGGAPVTPAADLTAAHRTLQRRYRELYAHALSLTELLHRTTHKLRCVRRDKAWLLDRLAAFEDATGGLAAAAPGPVAAATALPVGAGSASGGTTGAAVGGGSAAAAAAAAAAELPTIGGLAVGSETGRRGGSSSGGSSTGIGTVLTPTRGGGRLGAAGAASRARAGAAAGQATTAGEASVAAMPGMCQAQPAVAHDRPCRSLSMPGSTFCWKHSPHDPKSRYIFCRHTDPVTRKRCSNPIRKDAGSPLCTFHLVRGGSAAAERASASGGAPCDEPEALAGGAPARSPTPRSPPLPPPAPSPAPE